MAKQKLSELELKLKKLGILAKNYTDDQLDLSKVNMFVKGTPNTGFLKTYILTTAKSLAEVTVQNTIGEIDIPKDFLVKGASIEVVETADTPYTGAEVGDKYIDFVINTKGDGEAETPSHIYLPVQDLVDVYTGSNAIQVGNDNVISIILNSTASGLEITANGLSIKIDSSNANGLAITAAGLKLGLASASTNGVGGSNGAMSATDKELIDKLHIDLLNDAELGSWFGYAANSTMVTTTLPAVSDDSITDEV